MMRVEGLLLEMGKWFSDRLELTPPLTLAIPEPQRIANIPHCPVTFVHSRCQLHAAVQVPGYLELGEDMRCH